PCSTACSINYRSGSDRGVLQGIHEHMNRLRHAHVASEAGLHAELAKIEREADRLVQVICNGVPGSKVKDRITELETRKVEIKARLSNTDTSPPLMPPCMAGYCRQQVSKLRGALAHPDNRTEAADISHTLIDRIELKPVKFDGKKTLAIDLHGHLASSLFLANEPKQRWDWGKRCRKVHSDRCGGTQQPLCTFRRERAISGVILIDQQVLKARSNELLTSYKDSSSLIMP
ncbi:MAG: hypothetical protein ACR2RE_20165, partial [Geminicoccaceae bacterium]